MAPNSRFSYIFVAISFVSTALLYVYFKNKVDKVDEKLDMMYQLIQSHAIENDSRNNDIMRNSMISNDNELSQMQDSNNSEGGYSDNLIEVSENAQVGDTIATIQYCSSGEWKKLEAEFFSTLALKENGQLYTWGINSEGGKWPPITAGADPNQAIIFNPTVVKDPVDNSQDFILDDVASSIYMAFGIKSEDKSLWGWGKCSSPARGTMSARRGLPFQRNT